MEGRFEPPTIKQHLSAVRALYAFLRSMGAVTTNPAAIVQGPSYAFRRKPSTPLDLSNPRRLIEAIDPSNLVGLRDRALVAVAACTGARIGAVVTMRVHDVFTDRGRWWLRLHDKSGQSRVIIAPYDVEGDLIAYLDAAGIRKNGTTPLFRAASDRGGLTAQPLNRFEAYRVIQDRSVQAARHRMAEALTQNL